MKMLSTCICVFYWFFTILECGALSLDLTMPVDSAEPHTENHLFHESNDTNLACTDGTVIESEYTLLQNGSLFIPQKNHIYSHDSFLIRNDSVIICATNAEKIESEVNHNFTEEFHSCLQIFLESDEFELFQNGTVHVDVYDKYFKPTEYHLKDNGVYICVPNFDEIAMNSTDPTIVRNPKKFPEAFVYVSHVGLGISIISLVLHLVVFCCVSNVRNLPGCCLASLSVSLLVAYLCFVCSSFVRNKEECAHLGTCLYYFFLTSFFWMNVIAFDVWRSFRVVMKELRISSHRVPWRRFLLYSIYSWLVPAGLVALAKVADTSDILPEEFRPSFGTRICWFGHRKALLLFFAAPLCFIMLMNGAFFLDSAYVINRATLKASHVDKVLLTRRFFMFMRLALLMGLTWVIGIVAGYVDNHVLWYIFVLLNTLQGLFIFIVFSCSSKVRISFMMKLQGRGGKRQSLSVRTISQASGAI